MEEKLKGFHFPEIRDMLFECGVKVFCVVGSAALYMHMKSNTNWEPNDFDILVSPADCGEDGFMPELRDMCEKKKWPFAMSPESFEVCTPTMKFQIILRDVLEVIGQFDISICRIARVYSRFGPAPFFIYEGDVLNDIFHDQFRVGAHYLVPYGRGSGVSPAEYARTRERIAKYEARGYMAVGTTDASYVSSIDFTAPVYPLSDEDEPPSKKHKPEEAVANEESLLDQVD